MTNAARILLFCWMFTPAIFADSLAPSGSPSPTPRKLIVGIWSAPPFNMRQADRSWTGLSVDLWREIASDLKTDFEFREIRVDDRFGALMNGWIDVCVGPTTITAQREEMIDFTHQFFSAGLRVAMRTKDVRNDSNLILPLLRKLFSREVLKIFLLIFGILLVAAILIWLCERRKNPAHFGGQGKKLSGIGSAVWWSAVTMTGVGYGDLYPRTLTGRIVAVTWMFISLVLISIFTATMASLLTAEKLGRQKVIQSPQDLKGLIIGTGPNTTGQGYARENHLDFRVLEGDQLLPALETGRIDAVINDGPILSYEIHTRYRDKLLVLPIHLNAEYYAFCVKEGSSLREPINRSLLGRLAEPEWQDLVRHYLGEYE